MQFEQHCHNMKKIALFLFVFSTLIAAAQNKSSIETRALVKNLNQAKSVDNMSKSLLDRYPIRYENGVAYIGVIAKVDNTFSAANVEAKGVRVTSRVGDIVTMRTPIEALPMLEGVSGIKYMTVAHHVAPMMDNTRVDTRTDSVQAGLGLPMPFNGEGVLIGITDWGFDYTHPNINKANNLRVLRAWDHFKLSGPAPEGFNYGTEYKTPEEVYAAQCDTFGLYGYGTHGTHVAGICGGNGTATGHVIGQAPKAKFILGSWYLDEASWLDQVAWMKRVADEEGKRLVINSSWGMYTFSTLDGTSLLSEAINSYSDSGIVFVTSGGNNGDVNFHLQHTFGQEDTLISIATYYADGIGQGLIYWGEENGAPFEAGFALVENGGSHNIHYSPMYSTSGDIDYLESYLVAGNDTIHYDIMIEARNPLDNRPHILLNVQKNYGYKLMMRCTSSEGATVHVWNMTNLANNAGNMGCDFVNSGIFGCQNGDKFYGIGEPACAEKAITVAAHIADTYRNDVYTTGGLTYFSSFGPTLDGRNKPEISAPGSNVVSSISSFTDLTNYSPVYQGQINGRRYMWSTMSGTSMSSPAVTGIVALMLQANPNLTVDQIREILFTTVRNDDKTGPLRANDSISNSWGYGKADALRAVSAAYDRLSVEQAADIRPELIVFPNPTANMVTVVTGSNEPELMEVFTIDGHRVMSRNIMSNTEIDLGGMAQGVYFVRVHDRAGVRTAKLIKN